ncbi:MAG TPA: DUF998 domain-containing protein [Anaerolineales bacterium]|nr:DUF998 domain-containing protein [Anaerolineales bacterium]
MNEIISKSKPSTTSAIVGSQIAARLSFGAAVTTLVLLGALHILSPEFAPSWRMVSEYANGQYGRVLLLMFASWAASSWALAYALKSQVTTTSGTIGLMFLLAAGVGEAMGGLFDINHPLHGLASLIGISSLPIAALLISVSLSRRQAWFDAKKALLWTANLTWISVLLMAAMFIILMVTFIQSGAEMPAEGTVLTTLPVGVIALVGWANRFLVVVYNVWVIVVASRTAQMTSSNSL